MIWLSKSKILTYLDCAYRYKLLYIDKIEVPPTYAMERGTEIHQLLENFYDYVRKGNGIMNYARGTKHYNSIRKFLEMEAERYEYLVSKGKVEDFYPVEQEIKISNNVLGLSGIIDAIYRNNGSYVVIDYKTSDYSKDHWDIEIPFYVYLINRSELEYKIDYGGYFFLNKYGYIKKVNSSHIRNIQKVIRRVRNRMEEKKFPYNEEKCEYCFVKKYCDLWK